MARTRTLAELRAEVRQRADVENDPHITDAEVTRFINQSCAALHAILVEADEAFFMLSATTTTVAGVETVSLSDMDATFYKLLHVEALVSGIYIPLERWTFERRTLYRNASTWGVPGLPLSYRLSIGTKAFLYFAPIPDAAYPLIVTYVKCFADMTLDADVFNGQDGWEEWVIWDATIKCLVKGEESVVDATRERAEVLARILPQLATPDRDHPDVTRDVVGAGRDAVYRFNGVRS